RGRAGAHLPRSAARGLWSRSAGTAPSGPHNYRYSGQHSSPGLHRAQRHARAHQCGVQGFRAPAHIIDKIVSNVGRRVDESSPICDARLEDGSRVNVVIPPLSIDGPIMSIRRFGRTPIGVEQLIAGRALTNPMLELLRAAVKARLNLVISGGTGAGK